MPSAFDRDVADLSEEGEDEYYAQTTPGKKAGTPGSPNDDDEEEDQPSVEKILAETEAGKFEEESKKKKKIVETEDRPKSDLELIDEAADQVEEERIELFNAEPDES